MQENWTVLTWIQYFGLKNNLEMKDYSGAEWMLFDSVERLQHSIIIIHDYFTIWWIGHEFEQFYTWGLDLRVDLLPAI